MTMQNKKPITGVAIYDTYMLMCECDFDEWVKIRRQSLLAQTADLVENKEFYGKFDVEPLNMAEIHEEIERHRRADCQYTFKGEFVGYNDLVKIIQANCKKLVFRGYVVEGVEELEDQQ